MMILNYLRKVNVYLVILDILFLIISFLFLNKKKSSQRKKDLFVISYTLINMFLFSELNDFFNKVFMFDNISIKVSLIVVVISYLIFFVTINKDSVSKLYKVINIVLFGIVNVLELVNVYIILSIKMDFVSVINLDKPKMLNNIIVMVFICYLIMMGLVFVIGSLKEVVLIRKNKKKDLLEDESINSNIDNYNRVGMLSVEELLNYDRNRALYINGVDCSIIFNDSNVNNIIRNYQILFNDIGAKMVNGYTLDENIMLRNICMKLNTNNLFAINLDNFNILNRISVEEYNLLKKIKGIY